MILYNNRDPDKLYSDGVVIEIIRRPRHKFGYTYVFGIRKVDDRRRYGWYDIYFIWFRIKIAFYTRGRKI